MANKVIKLTESEFKELIRETVENVLDEMEAINEGAGLNLTKKLYKGIKNASPESINQWNDEFWKGGIAKGIIKGEPNEQEYHNLKFDRVNNLSKKDKSANEVLAQPGIAGKAKRAAIAGVTGAMLGGRKISDKMKSLKNRKNRNGDYDSFTM